MALHCHKNSHSTTLSDSTAMHLTCHLIGSNNILYFCLSLSNIIKIENTIYTVKQTRSWQSKCC